MNNIELLKSLTQTTFDSVEGYRKAIEKTDSPALKDAFERRMNARQKTLETLNTALANNGEERITSASISSTAHQMFLNIADAFQNGDKAVIERVEEGEDYIAKQFRDVLDRTDLDASMRSLIEQASREVIEGERFSDMLEKQYA